MAQPAAATKQFIFVPNTKEEENNEEIVFKNASELSDLFTSLSQTSIKQWISAPVREMPNLKPFILNDPIKLSDFSIPPDQDLVSENLEKDFVFNQNIDVDRRTIRIAARSIVICPRIHVRARNIIFHSPNGYTNFGRLTYQQFDKEASENYSRLQVYFHFDKIRTDLPS